MKSVAKAHENKIFGIVTRLVNRPRPHRSMEKHLDF
jgi:hypothetical protein